MTRLFFLLLNFGISSVAFSQATFEYRPLDGSQPIHFDGRRIIFSGDTIITGPKAFFIDGNLHDSVAAKFPFVFKTLQAAVPKLSAGTEHEPMVLYIAPWVYWIDNPDDTAVRVPEPGANAPYGMEITCEWLRFQGLTRDPGNLVLASNRGQSIGAKGNFTMFRFSGNGTASENLTFGNYCNVDLVFPLKPSLGRPKRASAIVQAQLIHCNGDKIIARNTHFISRLNLCPFAGAKRILFDQCHFESTDDALCSTGLYLHSTFDFYSSKPFYNTRGTGAVLLNCDVRSMSGAHQYFTKAGGQVTVVDSRLTGEPGSYWGWQDVVPKTLRNYQAGISLNGKPLLIGSTNPFSTINMENIKLLDAYRIKHADTVVYNTYNLLAGNDDWDPMGVKAIVAMAENTSAKKLSGIPVQLIVMPTAEVAETNNNKTILTAKLFRFGNYEAGAETLTWSVAAADSALLTLQPSEDGMSCTVIPKNKTGASRDVVINATTGFGLQGASVIKVLPPIKPAPAFKSNPKLTGPSAGRITLNYLLNSKDADASVIIWYRAEKKDGSDRIEVAVSHAEEPMKTYLLSAGDIGYYLLAEVVPKTVGSRAGKSVTFSTGQPVEAKDVTANQLEMKTNFANQALRNQPRVLPGFFRFMPAPLNEPDPANRADSSKDAWYFGEGEDGAARQRGLVQARHARMSYTPMGTTYSDMELRIELSPFKTAGQGFSVAGLYMDVLIKLDAANMNGYALRLIRTTKYSDAVDCILMKYTYGKAVPISAPVTTSAYRTPCVITMQVQGKILRANVSSTSPAAVASGAVKAHVALESRIEPGTAGGYGIEYHGGSATMINQVLVKWSSR